MAGKAVEQAEQSGVTTPRRRLDRPGIRHRLIGDLARDLVSRRQLAADYGVVPSAITGFARRYAKEIEERRGALEAQLNGLWITQKYDRLAAYQALAERCQNAIEAACEEAEKSGDPSGVVVWLQSAEFKRLADVLTQTLRYSAEELGALPQRVTLNIRDERAKHIIEGVVLDQL